ncbi:MAG TPA: SUMF1/EgtB/PvdO family nonheme iron enzyme [Bacteroidales bacterium]|nr:SUMF1/EgtB/PvdO family nonheme iron enzyme [Bacteroidales bacterium]
MTPGIFKRIQIWTLVAGIISGALLLLGFNKVVKYTSTDEFCDKCHLHPHSTDTWKQSVHYHTESGTIVHCVECHLPPKGEGYLPAKVVTGLRDVYGAIFKDSSELNWALKSRPENAVHFTKDVSCLHCHVSLYPVEISRDGMDAHLYYEQQEGAVACIKCHIDAGHYHEGDLHSANTDFGTDKGLPDTLYSEPTPITEFDDFTEQIPHSAVTFTMKAIPGGIYQQGAVEEDDYAADDERPNREVKVDSFFMGETEVTWDEFLTWYAQTSGEGRTTDVGMLEGVDGMTGATPPYGNPDQGWGRGKRPAITMTYYAAEKYCEWLSMVTGKKYRLPTEAEWEYAARGGTSGVYFFEGDVKDYSDAGLRARLFGIDTSTINTYVTYTENSGGKTQLPDAVSPNPFGLKHMLGNVAEFCLDGYEADAYSTTEGMVDNPLVKDGREHVIRGGSYQSNAEQLRISDRAKTNHDAWMRTDPQIPKSLWWYSDCAHVGIRVVCEY